MLKIVDDFLEKDLIEYLETYFTTIPHYYGHSSNGLDNGTSFYMSHLDISNPLINFLCLKVQKQIESKLGFLRVYINIHYSNMPGDFHEDDGDLTILLMVSKTLQKESGQFQIKLNNNEDKIYPVDFIQNRLIIFPANWKHRGLAPIEHNTPRITLAFKTKMV
jgi:hypothetical protein